MEKIVFVCLGNICRSPMAEFVMKDLVEKAGNPIHSGTQTKLKEQKIAFDLHKGSQKISSEDFYEFDKIIAMDESNLENLRKMAPEGTSQKIAMLLEQGVPDPWFTGDFQETYQLVKTGCQRLLDEIV